MDEEGRIVCGGRLTASDLKFATNHPLLVPDTDMGLALIENIHASTEHAGRKITTLTVRQKGYHLVGGQRTIDDMIRNCVHCRQLRAPTMTQKMADLPTQRLDRTPPFWHCGMDVFGPFHILHGTTTRAQTGTKKVWVLLFSCLYSRAVRH